MKCKYSLSCYITMRVPIINASKCRPTKCRQECGLICPPNQQGAKCVELVDIEDIGKVRKIAKVNESLCTSCGMCAGKRGCPFGAIQMVNLPTEVASECVHKYGANGFRLYRLPELRKGKVVGLIGANGIGKSTITAILSGRIRPNLGVDATDKDVRSRFSGSETGAVMASSPKVAAKPQKISALRKVAGDPTVNEWILSRGEFLTVPAQNMVKSILSKRLSWLSGGELQKVACASVMSRPSDVYIFDEPMNFLDIESRLEMAQAIRTLSEANPDAYILVIEHDLALLDYMSDSVHVLYGTPGAFGVVSLPLSTSNGVNAYFDGRLSAENVRFRESALSLGGMTTPQDFEVSTVRVPYDAAVLTRGDFTLTVEQGTVAAVSSLTLLLGPNGAGKTTLVTHLAEQLSSSHISVKPQILPTPSGSVLDALCNAAPLISNAQWKSEVLFPLGVNKMYEREVSTLSGGELQRFSIALALGKDVPVYFLDEPSSDLDIEQRSILARVLKRFTVHQKKRVFVVDHDVMLIAALGAEYNTSVIRLSGGLQSTAFSSQSFADGFDAFLRHMDLTFRVENANSANRRPRLNKPGSQKDVQQRRAGTFYV